MAFRSLWSSERKPTPRPHPHQERITRYATAAAAAQQHRKMFQTEDWKVGHGPATLDPGQEDVVCILQGAEVPFVLRPRGISRYKNQSYEVVGECYVHGIMDGEAVEGLEQIDTRWSTFDLV
ncbi:hypothetical protein BDV96DRAFT_566128 [Lophiotrema nucula]|uniref:Uncharacterized protein n=1 Tax=Lophiotrema nucula TaxID=690887 RepID=A0A6A5ZN35_9PLEO|nr:hypothetical protein BDV96DRAFT_566128 [Lophiotrema nucula]